MGSIGNSLSLDRDILSSAVRAVSPWRGRGGGGVATTLSRKGGALDRIGWPLLVTEVLLGGTEGGEREGGVREGGVREGGVREGGVREGGVREGGGVEWWELRG